MHGRRRSGTDAVFGQEPGDGGLAKRGLDPAHRSPASRARVEVGTKNVGEQPRPALARRGAGVVFVGVGVVAAERGCGDYFGLDLNVTESSRRATTSFHRSSYFGNPVGGHSSISSSGRSGASSV